MRKRLEHLVGDGVLPTLLEPAVVIGAQPGEHGELLLAQTRHPPRAGEGGDAGLGRRQAVAPRTQEGTECGAVGRHTPSVGATPGFTLGTA